MNYKILDHRQVKPGAGLTTNCARLPSGALQKNTKTTPSGSGV